MLAKDIMNKSQILKKKEVVQKIENTIKSNSAIIFYNFSHASSNEIFKLKKELREKKCSWFTFKNTLFKKAVQNTLGIELGDSLRMNNAFIFIKDDQYSPLKILKNFEFNSDFKGRIQGGIYNNNFISDKQLEELSSISSKETLIFEFRSILMFEISRFTRFIKEIEKGKS